MRERGRGSHRVQQRCTGDPVVAVVEVVLPEEDGRRIVAADDVGTHGAHPLDQRAPELVGIGQFPVREAEVLHGGQADQGRRRFQLGRPLSGQLRRVDVGVGRALAPVGADDEVDGCPALAQRASVPPQATSASSGCA